MSVKQYNYEYFCGANVSVFFNDNEQLDVAGISYQLQDSSTPIYGYASRTFDAVAPGQKIVRGTFVVNFIEFNTVAKSIMSTKVKLARSGFEANPTVDGMASPYNASSDGMSGYQNAYEYHLNHISKEFCDEEGIALLPDKIDAFYTYVERIMYSDTYDQFDAISMGQNLLEDFSLQRKKIPVKIPNSVLNRSSVNALLSGPFNIKIFFGDRPENNSLRPNHIEIVSCYVNQISGTMQINEDVLLQEFSFFGRDIISN